jgi:hypothetical protein
MPVLHVTAKEPVLIEIRIELFIIQIGNQIQNTHLTPCYDPGLSTPSLHQP